MTKRIITAVAGVAGLAAGYALWWWLFGAFEASIPVETMSTLRQSEPFGLLMGVSAGFVVVGSLFACTLLAEAIVDLVTRARARARAQEGQGSHARARLGA